LRWGSTTIADTAISEIAMSGSHVGDQGDSGLIVLAASNSHFDPKQTCIKKTIEIRPPSWNSGNVRD